MYMSPYSASHSVEYIVAMADSPGVDAATICRPIFAAFALV